MGLNIYMLERLVEQRRAISLYDTDFELPDRLCSNEWQLATKIVKLLEPMQRITKEFSAKWGYDVTGHTIPRDFKDGAGLK